jgi:hypothetical protein
MKNINIWVTLTREKYQTLTERELKLLSVEAANLWYLGEDSELSNLFDQYVMMKNLCSNAPNEKD